MRSSSFALLLSVATLAPLAAASASEYSIDPSHSQAAFSVRHLMISNVRGEFGKTTGSVTVDDADITRSTVSATIDATTINTREPKRDGHLRSPDFFDTAKFPTITFKSTSVKKAGKDKLTVAGDLTMHGVTKPVTLEVTLTPELKSPFGDVRRGVQATTKLNRKDFGLTWNKALETGGVVVGDEVAVTLDVELVKQQGGGRPAQP